MRSKITKAKLDTSGVKKRGGEFIESELQAAGKSALLDVVRSVQPADMVCSYVRQSHALGLGHAVLCAEALVGDEPFAVLLADDLMRGVPGGPGVLQQMAQAHAQHGGSILAVQEVPLDQVNRYGIVAGTHPSDGLIDVQQMVEKPAPDKAPSRMGVAGRYILTPGIFDEIRNQPTGGGGEIQLTDAIARLMQRQPGKHAAPGRQLACDRAWR